MSKKIQPKYGTQPVQEVPAFSFKDDDIEQLLNAMSPVNRNRAEILRQLNNIASDYLWQRNQNQQKPTRAEQNAALIEIRQFAREHRLGLRRLIKMLRGLDMGTEWEIVQNLLGAEMDPDAITDLADRLDDFVSAAEQALQIGRKQTGPRIPTWLERAVVRLANLYDWVTGEPFSHNPKVKTVYDGHPHSREGIFIVTFFAIVDPEVTPKSLSTVLASVVRIRRRDRRLTSN